MVSVMNKLTPARITLTERLIRSHIRRTPVMETCGADFDLGHATVLFKLELCQHAGSFKTRGAFANLLSREIPQAGVVAASGGNHGVAVAFAAKEHIRARRSVRRRFRSAPAWKSTSSPRSVQRTVREASNNLCVPGSLR